MSKSRSVRTLALAGLALAATAPAAQAEPARRMVSYDSASPDAKRLTGAGLTFVFTKTLMQRQRIWAVRATAVPVGVVPEPLRNSDTVRALDGLMGKDAGTGTLYEITPEKQEAKVMVQAFCPGSNKGWLAVSPIAHGRDLRVHAFGDDAATGQPRLCAVMDFTWRGEWQMPKTNNSDITARVMRPDYGKPGGN